MNSYEEKQEARRQRYLERAEKARLEGNAKHEQAHQMASVIPFGQPIHVGHYSEGRDRRYRERIHNLFGNAFAAMEKADYYKEKASAVGLGGISSDDPDAIEKLSKKLEGLKESHELMKKVNRVIRQGKKDLTRINGLIALGFSEMEAEKLVQPDFCGRVGFPAYALANNNANMHRIQQRIDELERVQNSQDKTIETELYVYRESASENRVMFEFEGKPSLEVRNVLKRHGFKWSPRRLAWVRYLNGNGIFAAKLVIEQLNAIK